MAVTDLPLQPPRIEIQIGTVVTQAWAEVQHNIIYKNPHNLRITPTMKRIVDAVNGLAITTDIMLKELDQSLEQARKDLEMKREGEKNWSAP
ncbi:putative ankyrin repeat protein [Rosellinia necatrix]|uniref:Putative ankyrin repeat protein n=1 Tax=Rosellinia necatrix TaxID=77044 RepID=A0A1S8A765_ROSNE|nr:putative ankyrin repeat protein [Rosellinia necatrix]